MSSAKRSALAPDLPTVAEGGVPGFEVRVWYGVAVPAGTPKEIVKKLNSEINKILAMPDVKQQFAALGVEPIGGTQEQFGEHIKAETAKWAKVVKDAGIQPE